MPSIPSHSRRQFLFLFALSIPLTLLFFLSFSNHHHLHPSIFLPFTEDPLPPLPPPTYPSLKDGSWMALPEPIKSQTDLFARFPGSEGKISNRSCAGKPGGDGWERLFEVASWDWVDESGRKMGWDARAFVVQCLRREGGVLLVGDSLTLQHYDAIFLLLQSLSLSFPSYAHLTSPIVIHRTEQLQGRMPVHQTISLNLEHPASAELLLEAGVDASRGERPLVRALRSDLLGRREDLEVLMGQKEVS
ncbi:hypothetical protein BDY24DRAFT_55399 [Mrakia frigida]|uniref:uncharacterized protein n=1 Tax=Mrakia frigida TaxID=29902 RepID=UPI003FCC1B78